MRFIVLFFISTVAISSLMFSGGSSIGVDQTISYFKVQSNEFSESVIQLRSAITQLKEHRPGTITDARKALVNCRLKYKKIEFFMEHFFNTVATVYNAPAKYEVDEPDMEYQTPVGFQVIEQLLYTDAVAGEKNKTELLQQADVLYASAADLKALLYGFQTNDKEILKSVQLELVRIMALGITGYDAPLLKSGIAESEAGMASIQYVLNSYASENTPGADSLKYYVDQSRKFLAASKTFDGFDRLGFLSRYAIPLQRHIHSLIKELHLEDGSNSGSINLQVGIFDPRAIRIDAFPGVMGTATALQVQLGKKLFFDKTLSGNQRVSCATCHDPSKYFTDGLKKSVAFDGHSSVTRNAPSLLYAAFQYRQFWDGKDSSIESQVNTVINNPNEMGGDTRNIVDALSGKEDYRQLFREVFPDSDNDSLISFKRLTSSIAAYVRSLQPFDSRFDRYMNKTGDLTEKEKHGFNLFMGKAQCGTCHFAPLFNGLVPPLYERTEVEILGAPATGSLNNPRADTDRGRYAFFPIRFYDGAFKTPTVRNVSKTAPYMHNGALPTLEKVMDFYNKGGGKGIGLDVPEQTLSDQKLQLSPAEIRDLIAFLKSLDDTGTFIEQHK